MKKKQRLLIFAEKERAAKEEKVRQIQDRRVRLGIDAPQEETISAKLLAEWRKENSPNSRARSKSADVSRRRNNSSTNTKNRGFPRKEIEQKLGDDHADNNEINVTENNKNIPFTKNGKFTNSNISVHSEVPLIKKPLDKIRERILNIEDFDKEINPKQRKLIRKKSGSQKKR